MTVAQVYATHDEVFPGLSSDFGEFKRIVKRLSRTDALLWCGRINLHLGYPLRHDAVEVQRALVETFFEPDEVARLRVLARSRAGGVQVFFRGQVLELIRWVVLLASDAEYDGKCFENPAARRDFSRAVLMASDIWARRVYPHDLSLEGGVDRARERALESLRRSTMENSSGPHPWLNLARGALVFERMTQASAELPEIFNDQVGLTPKEYFSALAFFLLFGFGKSLHDLKNPDASGLLNLDSLATSAGPIGRITSGYLEKEAQSPNELRRAMWGDATDADEERAGDFDLNVLRAKPILRAGGRGVILDPVLFAERATAGPLFYLVSSGRGHGADWLARFGDAFEAHALDAISRAFPPSSGPLQRFFPRAPGTNRSKQDVELADGVLLDVQDAVFFEMKAAWMNERNASVVDSPELYLAQIRRRYGTTEETTTKDQRVTGVGQIARALKRLASDEWKSSDFSFSSFRHVFPVLLVHDAYLDAAAHAHFLAEELAAALVGRDREPKWEPMPLGRTMIHHLIVVTIDDWELVESSLEGFSFGECLRAYVAACPDRLVSFREFLLTSTYRSKLRYSLPLRNERERLLEQAIVDLFPDDDEERRPV